MDRTQSILLQVAFKAAVERADEIGEIKDLTTAFYNVLVELHDELGVTNNTEAPAIEGVHAFTYEGATWFDFRDAKEKGNVKDRHPDFKTADNSRSVWLRTRSGETNDDALPLVEASAARIF